MSWEQFIFTMVVVRAVVINTGLPKDRFATLFFLAAVGGRAKSRGE